MFFVFFGLQIDPTVLTGVLPLAVALAVVTAATKLATGWYAAARAGIGRPGRLRAGVALVARGEFSIVIAGLATAAATEGTVELDERFAPLAGAYVLLLAVVGPLGMRLLDTRSTSRSARRGSLAAVGSNRPGTSSDRPAVAAAARGR